MSTITNTTITEPPGGNRIALERLSSPSLAQVASLSLCSQLFWLSSHNILLAFWIPWPSSATTFGQNSHNLLLPCNSALLLGFIIQSVKQSSVLHSFHFLKIHITAWTTKNASLICFVQPTYITSPSRDQTVSPPMQLGETLSNLKSYSIFEAEKNGVRSSRTSSSFTRQTMPKKSK